MIELRSDSFETAAGRLMVVVDGAGRLRRCSFVDGGRPPAQPLPSIIEEPEACRHVRTQLLEYFSGSRRSFDLELAPEGTPFQKRVWDALAAIPWGETRSYRQLAEAIGNPRALRAVGGANGANPLVVIIPCHRVIAADGSLGGFSAGSERKRILLALEGGLLF